MAFAPEPRLLAIIREMSMSRNAPETATQLADALQLVETHGEYGEAYEAIVCLLEQSDFVLSGRSAIYLLEVGLAFGYKTGREGDSAFDRRG